MPYPRISRCDHQFIVPYSHAAVASLAPVASVHGIGQPQDGCKLGDQDGDGAAAVARNIFLKELCLQLNLVIVKVPDIVTDHIGNDLPLQMAEADDLRGHDNIIGTLIGISDTDEFTACVKQDRDLKEQTLTAAKAMVFFMLSKIPRAYCSSTWLWLVWHL